MDGRSHIGTRGRFMEVFDKISIELMKSDEDNKNQLKESLSASILLIESLVPAPMLALANLPYPETQEASIAAAI